MVIAFRDVRALTGDHGMEMKCFGCGHGMTSGRENVKYDASGLPGVTLVDVEVSR